MGELYPLGESVPPQVVPKEERPRCSVHRTRMVYSSARDLMFCNADGCTRIARRNLDFVDAFNEEMEGSTSRIYRGAIQFVRGADGELYLYLDNCDAIVSLDGLKMPDPSKTDAQHLDDIMNTFNSMRVLAVQEAEEEMRRQFHSRIAGGLRQRMRVLGRAEKGEQLKTLSRLLPPHLEVWQIEKVREALVEIINLNPQIDLAVAIASAIEQVFQSVHRGTGFVRLEYYTVKGIRIDGDTVRLSEDELTMYGDIRTSFNIIMENVELDADEVPVYVMFGGYSLTLKMIETRLEELEVKAKEDAFSRIAGAYEVPPEMLY